MDITVTFTLAAGEEFVSSTDEFPTLEALQSELEKFVGHPAGRLTWHAPNGSKRMLAAQHIVAVTFAPSATDVGKAVVEAIKRYENRGNPTEQV